MILYNNNKSALDIFFFFMLKTWLSTLPNAGFFTAIFCFIGCFYQSPKASKSLSQSSPSQHLKVQWADEMLVGTGPPNTHFELAFHLKQTQKLGPNPTHSLVLKLSNSNPWLFFTLFHNFFWLTHPSFSLIFHTPHCHRPRCLLVRICTIFPFKNHFFLLFSLSTYLLWTFQTLFSLELNHLIKILNILLLSR